MTLIQAHQIISMYIDTRVVNEKIPNVISNALLDLEYSELNCDYLKGKRKWVYGTNFDSGFEHSFLHRIEFLRMARELGDAIYKICKSNKTTADIKRFGYVLNGLPEEFKNQVIKNRFWA